MIPYYYFFTMIPDLVDGCCYRVIGKVGETDSEDGLP